MHILISACLLGMACRYDGNVKDYPQIRELLQRSDLQFIPICPEQTGGLPTPRPASECCGSNVINSEGTDVTAQYEKGAAEACKLAKIFHCTHAVLKEKSPSCGSGKIYDGTFSRTLIDGDGITAAALKRAGIIVMGESKVNSIKF